MYSQIYIYMYVYMCIYVTRSSRTIYIYSTHVCIYLYTCIYIYIHIYTGIYMKTPAAGHRRTPLNMQAQPESSSHLRGT